MTRDALIITGTDTGVGKTILTATLARALRNRGVKVGVRKPFASGVTSGSTFHDDDALLLQAAAQSNEPVDQIRPATFSTPLAPLSAARLEGRSVDEAFLLQSIRTCVAHHTLTLIEGVGGAAVPVSPGVLFSDFARKLACPALIVARSGLGTVNHTLLTIEHLKSRGVEPAGIVFMRHSPGPLNLAEQTGPSLVEEFTGIRSFGLVPFVSDLAHAETAEEAARLLPVSCQAVTLLVEYLLSLTETADAPPPTGSDGLSYPP